MCTDRHNYNNTAGIGSTEFQLVDGIYLEPTPANFPVSQLNGVTAFAPRGPKPLPTPSDNGLDDANESFLAFVAFCTIEGIIMHNRKSSCETYLQCLSLQRLSRGLLRLG